NCPGVTLVCTPPSGSTFNKGANLVRCLATDASGNTNGCIFTVTINDREPPTVICSTNLVASTDPGQCSRSNVLYTATTADNCPGVTLVCTPPSGSTFNKGANLVRCLATDASGNTNGCIFTVTINDTEPPAVICSTNIVASTDPGQCSRSNVLYTATPADNCPGVTLVCTPPSGSTFNKGINLVRCLATDTSGNTNGCIFTVTINDSEAPSIICSTNIVASTDPGQCSRSNVLYIA